MLSKKTAILVLASVSLLTLGVSVSQRGRSSGWSLRQADPTAPAPRPQLDLTGRPVVVGQFGDPLREMTAAEFERFRLGLDDFLEVEEADEGLGPAFNGLSCAQCHSVPAIGGSSTVTEIRAGILHEDGSFEELPGGTVFQMFSIPTHASQAVIPPEANVIAHRKALQLFGLGLVEAVPDEVFLSLEDPDDRDGDGISGRAARVVDVDSGELRVGRFGWKAQQATLLTFGAEAYRDEMGITNALFPEEACPGGNREAVDLDDLVADPEDGPDRLTGLRGIDNFESFMRFLGAPPRGPVTEAAARGEQLFSRIGCDSCHLPSLQTGPDRSAALDQRVFHPYGDFLLHDIGTGDGIQQADASPFEIRTPPLWGVRVRAPFLHDGRAPTLESAIGQHDGEARASRLRFESLPLEEKQALLAFLRSL